MRCTGTHALKWDSIIWKCFQNARERESEKMIAFSMVEVIAHRDENDKLLSSHLNSLENYHSTFIYA